MIKFFIVSFHNFLNTKADNLYRCELEKHIELLLNKDL